MAVRRWFAGSLFALVVLAAASCARPKGDTQEADVPPDGTSNIPAIESAELTFERARPFFLRFYTPPEIEIEAKIPPYTLPLTPDEIANWAEASVHFKNEGTAALILKNGFAVEDGWGEQLGLIEAAYDNLPDGVPIFVTVDTALHIQHVLCDQLYSEIEHTYMLSDLQAITDAAFESFVQSHAAYQKSAGTSAKQAAAARRNLAYFTVSARLLDPKAAIPKPVEREVLGELRNIEAGGIAPSPIFIYRIDYSQLKPRGHYAQSEELQRYFRAMMWYAQCVFLLQDGVVDAGTADIQTIQAIQIGHFLAGNENALTYWQRMNAVIEFFAGTVDDVSVADVIRIKDALDKDLAAAGIGDGTGEAAYIRLLRERLLALPPPRIHAATGFPIRDEAATPERRRQWLEQARGMRLFGQRFSLDSYAMSELTGFAYMGEGRPFTRADTPMGPVRGYPTGLDVMALLGSKRAEEILRAAGDADYAHYDRDLARLRKEFGQLSDDDWHGNLAMWRINLIRMRLQPVPEGYPSAMRTAAWRDHGVHVALATWAQLQRRVGLAHKPAVKHPGGAWGPGLDNGAVSYVEPAPQIYAEVSAMNDLILKGLGSVQLKAVEDDGGRIRHERLHSVYTLERFAAWLDELTAISTKELRNEPLDEHDISSLDWVPDAVRLMTDDVDEELRHTAFVANAFTEPNEGRVLEVATGRLNLLWIVYQLPSGEKVIGAGPVMGYYEFKQPMDARLSDEDWREILTEDEAPDPPSWTKSFLTRRPRTPPKE